MAACIHQMAGAKKPTPHMLYDYPDAMHQIYLDIAAKINHQPSESLAATLFLPPVWSSTVMLCLA